MQSIGYKKGVIQILVHKLRVSYYHVKATKEVLHNQMIK